MVNLTIKGSLISSESQPIPYPIPLSEANSSETTIIPDPNAQSFKEIFNQIEKCKFNTEDSKYRANFRLFVTSNEKGKRKTLETMKNQVLVGDTIIAVSGFFGLNCASIRGMGSSDPHSKIKNIIMIDISPRVEHFWDHVEIVIKSSDNRLDTIEKIIHLIKSNKSHYFQCEHFPEEVIATVNIQEFEKEIVSGASWLSTDEQYATIKDIVDRGRFVFKRMNFCETDQFIKLRKIIKKHNIKVDSIYISNILHYLVKEKALEDAFFASVQAITPSESHLITSYPKRCNRRGCKHCQEDVEQLIVKLKGENVETILKDKSLLECRHTNLPITVLSVKEHEAIDILFSAVQEGDCSLM